MPDAVTQADAVKRSKRTLWQGLAIDIGVAVAAVLLLWLPDADISSREAWIVLSTSVIKTGLTAIASYVMRLKIAPN